MNQSDVAVRIYGLFAENNPALLAKIPTHIKEDARTLFKKEDVVAIDKDSMDRFIREMENGLYDPVNRKIRCFKVDRGYDEHFGPYIQVIGAACIHTADKVLMLELKKDTSIDGYVKGTLTYPQGHCTWTPAFEAAKSDDQMWTYYTFIQKIKEEIVREVQEEIGMPDTYYGYYSMDAIRNALLWTKGNGKLYPLYINRPGTTCRHLGMLADIDVTGTIIEERMNEIYSNERDKHEARVVTFEDLLKLDRPDLLCPWVAASFSKLPFMQTSFIEGYLKKSAT